MYCMGILFVFTVFVAYVVHVLVTPSSKKKSPLAPSGFRLMYWPKWLWKAAAIKLWQINSPKRLNDYNPKAFSYDSCGVVPSQSEHKLENPKTLITDRHENGMLIWGGDENGRMIVAKVVRLSRRRASIFLMVKDEKGNLFTLPNQPDSNVINIANEDSWRGNGLLLECVEPMRTWRVKFNGLLRKGTRDNYITDDKDDDDEQVDTESGGKSSILHVRIDFLWKAMRAPVDIWKDTSYQTLAHSLARESSASVSSFKALDRDGYDQWGALHGTLKLGEEATQNWYLRGGRQHRWGMSDSATNLQKSVNLFTYLASGDIMWLEGFSYNTGISHCVLGYIQTASGSYHPISSSSLDLSELDENLENLSNIFVECKAGGKRFHWWNRLYEGVSVYTGDPWTLKHDIRPAYSASSLKGEGWGLVILTNRFTGLCPVPEKENFIVPAVSMDRSHENLLVVPLLETVSSIVSLTGGKGASLSVLKYIENQTEEPSLKFSVPNGVVITSNAWLKQIEKSTDLKNAILSVEKAIISTHANRIKEACMKVQTMIESQEINNDIFDCLNQELNNLFSDSLTTKRFAVRSSACGEDSSEASSAGQNETILGCYWKEKESRESTSILRAILTCWGSQFSFQSVEYRRQRGQPIRDGMAVVVQEMVPAKLAGVMFTRDPVTGSPESIMISANYGLAESVVSAAAEPDTVLVKRTWRNKLSIQSMAVGEKKIKHIMKDNGGTTEVEVSTEERSTICISDSDALRLTRIGIYIEDFYGSPRDIEFAIANDQIFLLQARPLTSLDEWTDYELIHELDPAFISERDIYTTANVGEVFNGYICPLTVSTMVKMLDISTQRDFIYRFWPKYKFDSTYFRNFAISQGHCLINYGEACYQVVEDSVTMVDKTVDLAIFGRVVTTPEINKWATSRYGVMTPLSKAVRNGYAFMDMFFNSRRVKRCKPIYSNYEIDVSRVHSALDLFKKISSKLSDFSLVSENHIHTSSASTMAQCVALVIMAETKGEIDQAMIQDMAALLSCLSETESADVPVSLKAIAKTIAANEEMEEFLLMTPDEGKVWLESHPGAVGEVFRSFLQKHGHRCIKEFDYRSLPWRMAPETLVGTIQMMVKNPATYSTSKKAVDLDEILDNLKCSLPASKKRVLKFILGICATAVSLRESTKSMIIKTVDAFRKAYRTLGQMMVAECRMPDPELIFFLQHREIGILLETHSVRLISKAIRRRKLMAQLEQLEFPELSFGIPQPINSECSEDVVDDGTATIHGTPVCHGVATGTARVITSLQEAIHIQNGDILVTFCTDVGWTPYFPLLAGVVTEIGGLISHGAVVAREYGLPCIVGVKGATKLIVSGDRVILNGEEGFIKKVSNIKPET